MSLWVSVWHNSMIISLMRDNQSMTLNRFCMAFDCNLIKEIVFQCVSTINHVYILVHDYELVIKERVNEIFKHP